MQTKQDSALCTSAYAAYVPILKQNKKVNTIHAHFIFVIRGIEADNENELRTLLVAHIISKQFGSHFQISFIQLSFNMHTRCIYYRYICLKPYEPESLSGIKQPNVNVR